MLNYRVSQSEDEEGEGGPHGHVIQHSQQPPRDRGRDLLERKHWTSEHYSYYTPLTPDCLGTARKRPRRNFLGWWT